MLDDDFEFGTGGIVAYVIEPSARLPREVRNVARERLDEALRVLDDLEGAGADDIEAAVHSARKRCKEARSLARLVRPSLGSDFGRFNATVRDAADILAPIRDAHAVLATFDDLTAVHDRGDDADLADVRSAHAATAEHLTASVTGGDPRIEAARALLHDARRQVKRWKLPNEFPRAGLERTYARGRRALRQARKKPTDDRMHEWRKAVKNLWYEVRLLERAAPSVLESLIDHLDDLAEALGDDHDLAVLVERLEADPERFGGLERACSAVSLARSQQDDLRRRAFRLGASLYVESATAFVNRLEAYWNTTVNRGPELATGGIAELAEEERNQSDRPDSAPPPGGIERERKFLVGEMPVLPDGGTPMRQGYLAIDGSVSVRVRDAGKCTLTVKAGRGAVRTELEWAIAREQFDAAWDQTRGRRVSKTRYELPLGEYVVELDVFHEDLHGLVLAEVEFSSDAELEAFEPPSWFGREVTDDVSYTNASLAVDAGRPGGGPNR